MWNCGLYIRALFLEDLQVYKVNVQDNDRGSVFSDVMMCHGSR